MAQRHGGRNLIYILPARPGRTGERFLEVAFGKGLHYLLSVCVQQRPVNPSQPNVTKKNGYILKCPLSWLK